MFRWWPSNENQQFSGIFKKFCFAIVSTFKPWWWTNMNSVKANWIRHSAKSPGQAEWFSLSWLTISSSTLLLYLWPLITFKFKLFSLDCCSFFAFSPSLPFFPFPFLIFFFLLLFPCFNSFAVIWLSVSSWSLQAGDRLKQILRVPWPEWLFSAPPDLQWDQSSSWDLTSVTSLLVT